MSSPRLFNHVLEKKEQEIINDLLLHDDQDAHHLICKLYRNYGVRFVEGINNTLNKILSIKVELLTELTNYLRFVMFTRSKLRVHKAISTVESEIIAYGKLRHQFRSVLMTKGGEHSITLKTTGEENNLTSSLEFLKL